MKKNNKNTATEEELLQRIKELEQQLQEKKAINKEARWQFYMLP